MRLSSKKSESSSLGAKSPAKKKKGKLKTEKKCLQCYKPRHIAKYCYKKRGVGKQPDGDAFVCNAGVSETWLADSGASAHMTSSEKYFLSYK